MPCFSPVTGWRSRETSPTTRKRNLVYNIRQGYTDIRAVRPCGNCVGCRVRKARNWAIRLQNEARCHENNLFVTLTYDSEHLPKNGSIDPIHPEKFMRGLRKKFGDGIRSFGCAEYGDKRQRPHYHLILFNFNFPDLKKLKKIKGKQYYSSKIADQIWKKGLIAISTVSYDTMNYVAGYVTKKLNGKKALKEYGGTIDAMGKVTYKIQPERSVCVSRMPGLGRAYYEANRRDYFPSDKAVVKGFEVRPPDYYYRMLEQSGKKDLDQKKLYLKVRAKRRAEAAEYSKIFSSIRMKQKEDWANSRQKGMKRRLEDGSENIHSLRQQSGSVPTTVLHEDSGRSDASNEGDSE